jgi:hypothetical protein
VEMAVQDRHSHIPCSTDPESTSTEVVVIVRIILGYCLLKMMGRDQTANNSFESQ